MFPRQVFYQETSMKLTAKSATTLSLDGAKDRAWFDEDISGFESAYVRAAARRGFIGIAPATSSVRLRWAARRQYHLPSREERRRARGQNSPRQRSGDGQARRQTRAGKHVRRGSTAIIEAKRKEWRVRTHSAVELHLLVYAVGLQGRPITAITQRDIALLLNKIAAASGDVSAIACAQR